MSEPIRLFHTGQPTQRSFTLADVVVIVGVAVLLFAGVQVAVNAPPAVRGPAISLAPSALPWYALLSVARMAAAYALSMIFTLVYGYVAAYNRRAERILMPLLDVLQSVPILSFLPVVLLSFSAIMPVSVAAEAASVILIFTSQAWNLTFAWYQSLNTIPKELREASATFGLNRWLRFKTMELPFGAIPLIWNSMMSWAGGWFFLMAAEIFTVGQRDFRLPGLGAYLRAAADQGNVRAVIWGLLTLVLVIVLLDQLIWRPLLAWSDRFKVEMVESDNPPTSWFYDALRDSRVAEWFARRVTGPLGERLDVWMARRMPVPPPLNSQPASRSRAESVVWGVAGVVLLYGVYRAGAMLLALSLAEWATIGLGVLSTLGRVLIALVVAVAWTVPVGVAIGTNRRIATWLQPVVQIIASIPATALFPVLLLFLLNFAGGLNLAAVLLMLLGTQWYLLFNIIAGATAIPQDLKYTASLLRLRGFARWRTLVLPALFPYLVTGAITAAGGAWNASIVAEYVVFGGKTYHVTGIGALIAQATAQGDYPLLLAGTLSLVVTVAVINRLVWRRLYRLAEERYRME
jgi:NitT/TauT family transport system permease protein